MKLNFSRNAYSEPILEDESWAYFYTRYASKFVSFNTYNGAALVCPNYFIKLIQTKAN